MGQTLLTAIGVFISTSIDYLFILIILFAQAKQPDTKRHVYLGQFIGTGILVAVSLLAAYVVNFVPEDWMIGFLGLIPIYLGIRVLLVDEDADEDEILEKVDQGGANRMYWTVALLTIAAGGDNLGIYIPYFAGLSWTDILIVIGVFIIGIVLLCELSDRLSSIPMINATIEKYERIIVPLVFIPLGIYIMVENGTLQYLWSLIVG
ncbi:CadD family cadmium resistance transporter [Fundicoccus culcitae]|uniref:CadD family cadmium resistance transporter n=1 Tax=Fundicoccus culcitae TaxID=2969821 RepID=A0ABY5PAB4_9LACT|nr:CadD family cadmium resistance transporter [Fundicoccus culcitae]UUX35418.1 CadD family cadmium resistance transporter [Fundicoccus culcitae]